MLSVISQSWSICRSAECLRVADSAPFAELLGPCWAIVSFTLDYERELETQKSSFNSTKQNVQFEMRIYYLLANE